MAEINVKAVTTVECKVILVLSESEAIALEAICGYGPDRFVEWFYKNMGKAYLKPHENAMRDLFKTVRAELPTQLRKVKEIRDFATTRKD